MYLPYFLYLLTLDGYLGFFLPFGHHEGYRYERGYAKYLFKSLRSILLWIYSEVELLDHMVVHCC